MSCRYVDLHFPVWLDECENMRHVCVGLLCMFDSEDRYSNQRDSFYKWLACAACHFFLPFNRNIKSDEIVTLWFEFWLFSCVCCYLRDGKNKAMGAFRWNRGICYRYVCCLLSICVSTCQAMPCQCHGYIKWFHFCKCSISVVIFKVRTYYFIHIHTIEILYWYCMSS